jgi:H+/Cl- antiporter ClcA
MNWQESAARFGTSARTIAAAAVVGVACGAASALFLFLLDRVTTTRGAHPALVFALPLAGVLLGFGYEKLGASVVRGNDLVIDTAHDGGPTLPTRMAPLVLGGTLLTHLFGGSAGREGTAVQIGASLADALARRFGAAGELRACMLTAGMAGGFGSVFGTPLAGAVFGAEVVVVGRIRSDRLVPAAVAAFVGDAVTRRLGIVHTPYPTLASTPLGPMLALKWLVVGAAIAIAVRAFIEATHRLKAWLGARVPRHAARAALGGIAVVLLWKVVGTSDYLGLGVPGIVASFDQPTGPSVFALKLLFTVVTLGTGFIGGEVTPLFFIGATLGAALAPVLGIPQPLAAAVGLSAMFGAASNTPVALTLMAIELFGGNVLPHAAIVMLVAWLLAGRRSIYRAQRGLEEK